MLTVKGKYDGKNLQLEEEVHVDHEMPVIVNFPELPPPEKPKEDDFREFLLNGPVWTDEQIADVEAFIERFRQWKI